jgi:hypothetical protein
LTDAILRKKTSKNVIDFIFLNFGGYALAESEATGYHAKFWRGDPALYTSAGFNANSQFI